LYCTTKSIDLLKETCFHTQNCPCGAVGANIGYVLGLLVHGKVVVEFGRKVFLVDCLHVLSKTLHMAKISIIGRCTKYCNEIKYDVI